MYHGFYGFKKNTKISLLVLATMCLLGVSSLLLSPATAAGSTFYVSPSGSDASVGSSSAPFKTLQAAVSKLKPGDTLNVKSGSYAGFIAGWDETGIYGVISGTISQPITIQADPSAAAGSVIINSHNQKTADGINFEPGCNYITIKGFTIKNSDGTITRSGIRYTESIGGKILNNNVDGSGRSNIFTSHAQNIDVENNIISHSSQEHGIYVSNSADNPIVKNNTSFSNANGGIQLNADISNGGDGIIKNALIEGNIIYDNGTAGGSAINLDGVQNSTIRNNVLYNNHSSGIALFMQDGAEASKNNLVVNNTILMPSGSRWPINIDNKSTGNKVTNNILLNDASRHGSIEISADSLSGFVSDYNIVTNIFMADKNTGDTNLTLAQWQAKTGQDKHSFIANAADLFVNSAANDYHLVNGSPAVDAGTLVMVASDIEGSARPKGAGDDIGAYEFDSESPASTTPAPEPTNTTPIDTSTTAPSVPVSTQPSESQNWLLIIVIIVLAVFVVTLLIVLIAILWSQGRKNKYQEQMQNQSQNQPQNQSQNQMPGPGQNQMPPQGPGV